MTNRQIARRLVLSERTVESHVRSILNKLGVLVLVVGTALLLGYGLRYMGPPAKVALGIAAGACLLGIGRSYRRPPAGFPPGLTPCW